MSIDFTILCTEPLPEDWTGDARVESDHFAFWIGSVEEWRESVAEMDDADDPIARQIKELSMRTWGFVAHMNCSSSAVEITERCASELTKRFGGVYYDDSGEAISRERKAGPKATGAELMGRWKKISQAAVRAEERKKEAEKNAWLREVAKDPEAAAEANDWSDVLPQEPEDDRTGA